MDDNLEERRAAALAASDLGQLAEAYRLWLLLAETGDAEAQGVVGSLMQYSFHRFENIEEFIAGTGPTIDAATAAADLEQSGRYLTASSAAGIGPCIVQPRHAVRRRVRWRIMGGSQSPRGRVVRIGLRPRVHRVRVAHARHRSGAAIPRCHGAVPH